MMEQDSIKAEFNESKAQTEKPVADVKVEYHFKDEAKTI